MTTALSVFLVGILLLQVVGTGTALATGTAAASEPVLSSSQSPLLLAQDSNVTDGNRTVTVESLTLDAPNGFRHNGTTAVWTDSNVTVSTTLRAERATNAYYEVCLRNLGPDNNTTTVGCNTTTVSTTGTPVSFAIGLNDTAPGRHRFVATADNAFGDGDRAAEPLETSLYVLNRSADLDEDGVPNGEERERGLNMTNSDSDGDGLTDSAELDVHGTDPGARDTDGDGAPDNVEVNSASNATLPDTDADGVLDGTELEQNLDPTSAYSDEDNLTDARELAGETDPLQADTDGDGLKDGRELAVGTDPLVADTDADGVVDGREVALGIDPLEADTDGDFLQDGLELLIGLNPASALQTVLLALLVSGLLAALGIALYRSDRATLPVDTDFQSEPDAPPSTDGGASESSSNDDQPSEPPVELLAPPDRVERILDRNDGHVPQADIVEQTDWSKAKVSRTLTKMEDEGEITRYRLGRGNVVTYPEVDPAGNRMQENESGST